MSFVYSSVRFPRNVGRTARRETGKNCEITGFPVRYNKANAFVLGLMLFNKFFSLQGPNSITRFP